jgi:hypothetical protein
MQELRRTGGLWIDRPSRVIFRRRLGIWTQFGRWLLHWLIEWHLFGPVLLARDHAFHSIELASEAAGQWRSPALAEAKRPKHKIAIFQRDT